MVEKPWCLKWTSEPISKTVSSRETERGTGSEAGGPNHRVHWWNCTFQNSITSWGPSAQTSESYDGWRLARGHIQTTMPTFWALGLLWGGGKMISFKICFVIVARLFLNNFKNNAWTSMYICSDLLTGSSLPNSPPSFDTEMQHVMFVQSLLIISGDIRTGQLSNRRANIV